jgi:hypothetical protein
MGMKNSQPDSEDCHIVALRDGHEIFIDQADSGRGYTCIGCGKEMQAVKIKVRNHRSYFRHHPDGANPNNKCTWSDETYRHGVAKQILTQIKMIKVPTVKKYPVTGDGPAMIIRRKRIITADHVEPEVYFFEDKNGDIRFQKHIPNSEDCDNIIKPDVVFFDKDKQPILFIELVATHKITTEKKIKIKNIGVDTVQVSVAKDSRQAIEKSFYKTKRTKWVFNNEYERTPYLSPTGEIERTIQPVDKDQQRLHEETLACRTAEIGAIIRSINRFIQSDRYREVVEGVGNEIARVNTDIGTATIQLRDRDAQLDTDARNTFKSTVERNSHEQSELDAAFENLRRAEAAEWKEKRSLEDRERELRESYQKRISRISGQEGKFIAELEQEERSYNTKVENAGRVRSDGRESAKAKRTRMERNFETEKRNTDQTISNEERSVRELEEQLGKLSSRFEDEERAENDSLEHTEGNEKEIIADLEQRIEQLPEKFEKLRNRASEESRTLEAEITGGFQQLRDGILSAFQDSNCERASKYSKRIAELFQLRGLVLDLAQKQSALQRLRRAYESVDKKTFENWPEFTRLSKNHG